MDARRIAIPLATLALMAMSAPLAPAVDLGSVSVRAPGTDPLRDGKAANRVNEKRWEPRRGNRRENRNVPSDRELAEFRRKSVIAYRHEVTGRYRGTTDEIIQWAARKWGFDPDLFRAVAYVESRWRMNAVGDGGLSYGLFQLKKTYYCCVEFTSRMSAFNADYYGAILRAYYDGRETWLNDMERGERYTRGDLWGSIGAHYAGRWRTGPAMDYVRMVKRALDDAPWRESDF
ncbi:MAG TPA: transglycosylase SLT domain-containing protein [Thermoleophilaceae bacterium]|nr:transglycosylase SLT domain-containing protein [Thermoleophilaceae bacterium]